MNSLIVVGNDLTMSAPEETVFGASSAGIVIGGFAQGNSVLNNEIRGSAGAALAVVDRNAGIPGEQLVRRKRSGWLPVVAR